MEPQISGEEKQAIEQIYNYASDLIIRQNRPDYEVVHLLQDKGLNESNAQLIVDKIVSQVNNAKRSKAKKDILYSTPDGRRIGYRGRDILYSNKEIQNIKSTVCGWFCISCIMFDFYANPALNQERKYKLF
jgi:hypothetical protein